MPIERLCQSSRLLADTRTCVLFSCKQALFSRCDSMGSPNLVLRPLSLFSASLMYPDTEFLQVRTFMCLLFVYNLQHMCCTQREGHRLASMNRWVARQAAEWLAVCRWRTYRTEISRTRSFGLYPIHGRSHCREAPYKRQTVSSSITNSYLFSICPG